MGRRAKTWRVLKWIGTVLCALIVAAAAITLRWHIGWLSPRRLVGVGAGAAYRSWAPDHPVIIRELWRSPAGLSVNAIAESWSDVARLWSWQALWPQSYWAVTTHFDTVPLWVFFVAAAVPTSVFWYLDPRRPPPGHCQKCGYNLTGNVSGRCPECGTAAPPLTG